MEKFQVVYMALLCVAALHIHNAAVVQKCNGIDDDPSQTYAIMLDAGSSGTKINLYRYSSVTGVGILPRFHQACYQSFKPGLSTIPNERAALEEYFRNVLTNAKKMVPEAKHNITQIFLFATAGFRFLSPDNATRLTENIKGILSDPSLSPFLFKSDGVNIISGEEEGVYAWIATNYLLGFFDQQKPENESVGILEMGGGSTQIAFIPTSPPYAGEFQVKLAGRLFEIYVHSYLQFGSNSINDWVAEILSTDRPGENQLVDPCILRGDSAVVKLDGGSSVTLQGSGDPAECKRIFEEILAPETGIRCSPKPCAIGSVYQPPVDSMKFYATHGFTYAPVAMKVLDADNVLHIERLEKAAFEYCSKSLDEIVASGIAREFASSNCMNGIYIPTILNMSYGFPRDTTNIVVASNIGDEGIEWTLGAVISQLSGNYVRRRRR